MQYIDNGDSYIVYTDIPYQAIVDWMELGALVDADRELYLAWTDSTEKVESYDVRFDYYALTTGGNDNEGLWFIGSESNHKYGVWRTTYTPPEHALKVRARVKPVAKKEKVNDKEQYVFTGTWSDWAKYTYPNVPPEVDPTPERPSAPTLELTDTNIIATVDTYDPNTTYIEFELIKDDTARTDYVYVEVKTNRAIGYFTKPTSGIRYKVRCQGVHGKTSSGGWGVRGQFSEYSSDLYMPPWKPAKFSKTLTKLSNESTIQLYWLKIDGADNVTSFEIQFTTNPTFFDSSEEVQSVEVTPDTYTDTDGKVYYMCEITGLTYQPITRYYFRARAKNNAGVSGWNSGWPYFNMRTGVAPSTPTSWSESSVLTVGDYVYLYWTHNSEDGSGQKNAVVEFEFDSGMTITNEELPASCPEVKNIGTNRHYVINPRESGSYFTNKFTDGATVKWRVKTLGALPNSYSPWSVQRLIEFHANPAVGVSLYYGSGYGYTIPGTDLDPYPINDNRNFKAFPLYVLSNLTPLTQDPVSIRYSIISNELYETTNNKGETVYVTVGETIYDRFVTSGWEVTTGGTRHIQAIQPWDVTFENGVSYTCKVEVLTNAGLKAENEQVFLVEFDSINLMPEASVALDEESYRTYITPRCYMYNGRVIDELSYRRVPENLTYSLTLSKELSINTAITFVDMDNSDPNNVEYTINGSRYSAKLYLSNRSFDVGTSSSFTVSYGFIRVLFAYDGDQTITFTFSTENQSYTLDVTEFNIITQYISNELITYEELGNREERASGLVYHTESTTSELAENVTLSVYRREVDGTFTEIATGIQNDGISTVIDPHPSLDYARYRIVAQSTVDGSINYYDMPDYPIRSPYIVIQWDEEWYDFSVTEESRIAEPVHTGSQVMIKGNVDVSNSYSPDVSMVEYIGRSHPVAYHGTQIGETASWSCAIPADDKDTLSAVRQLARWMGVCYVREPSGSGYWATVVVSFAQTHSEVLIPITFTITRIEGGM